MKHFFNKLFASPSPKGGYSIKGRKAQQQDAWYVSSNSSNGQLVLVADGVGGHAYGEFASQLCVDVFKDSFEKDDPIENVVEYLRKQALSIANSVWTKGRENTEYKDCGTTLSAFIVQKNQFYFVHIGDSRIYMLDRSDNLHRITRDQTIIQQLLEQNEILPEDISSHPQKNVMYSAIGQEPSSIQIDIRGPEPIRKGEYLFAFSDGVHDALTEQRIRELIISHKDDDRLAEILVNEAFEAGGKDNITACFYKK